MSLRIFCFIFSIGLLCGCDSRDAAPELNDPIYLSLNTEGLSAEKSLEESKKALEIARAELEKTEGITGVPRHKRLEIYFTADTEARTSEQRLTYIDAKKEVRRESDRLSYNKAMNDKLPWPPKGELAEYEEARDRSKRERNYTAVHADRLKKLTPKRAVASKEGGETPEKPPENSHE